MPVKRTHRKPAVPKEAVEAVKVANHIYASLKQPGAPKAHPMGYIMGACAVLKELFDQAVQQGANADDMKQQALQYVQNM